MISIRWLVVRGSWPAAKAPPSSAQAHPPGPGLPRQAPSVNTMVDVVGVPGTRAPYAALGIVPDVPISSRRCQRGPMIIDGFVHQLPDTAPSETREWLDSLDAVVDAHGKTRARFLMSKLLERARELQVGTPATVS